MNLSEENLKLLESFSNWANKSTGGSHPCDKSRWHKFIINSYRDNEIVSTEILGDWLINNGWRNFENQVRQLRLLYEEAISLLQANDRM